MPKRHTNRPFAACSVALGSASSEIQLIPAGPFRGVDGRPSGTPSWQLNPLTAERWLAELRQRKTRLVIDYEHQTLLSADNGRPAPAAGWFTGAGLEIRDGSLWATDVRWTDAARAAIEAEEYLYISPVFTFDPKTGEVTGLINAALTNSPAIDGMEQVLRAAASQFFTDQETDVDPKELRKALGLPEDATDEQVLAACSALRTECDELKAGNTELETQLAAAKQQTADDGGEPDPAKYVPIEVVAELRGQVAALSQSITGDKVDSLVTAALNDGRLLPAQKDWATSLGKKDLAALTAYLDSAEPIAGLRQQQTNGEGPANNGKNSHGLTPGQLAICKQLGQSPEDYKKQLDELEGETA
jgi:phage I-like protein